MDVAKRSPLSPVNGPQHAVRLGGTAVVKSNAGQPTVTYTKPSKAGFVAHGEVKQ